MGVYFELVIRLEQNPICLLLKFILINPFNANKAHDASDVADGCPQRAKIQVMTTFHRSEHSKVVDILSSRHFKTKSSFSL